MYSLNFIPRVTDTASNILGYYITNNTKLQTKKLQKLIKNINIIKKGHSSQKQLSMNEIKTNEKWIKKNSLDWAVH